MTYKLPPDNSIKGAGSLRNYINKFFAKREQPYTYEKDVEPLFRRSWPYTIKGDAVGITGSTFKVWEKLYNKEHEPH